jgi:hypothetical protein
MEFCGRRTDDSGATTALDIYRGLKHLYPPDEVDLRVVLIISARPQPNLADQSVKGTVFLDTLAPINAILKVRDGLANDAVGRACSEIYLDPSAAGGAKQSASNMPVSGIMENCKSSRFRIRLMGFRLAGRSRRPVLP